MNERPTHRGLKVGFLLLGAGVLCVALCAFFVERSLMEKLATQLALPCGLVGLSLVVATFVAFRVDRRRYGVPALMLLLFYWTTGCAVTSEWLLLMLEGRFAHVDPQAEPACDLLIVLGGGTMSNRDGDVWLGTFGERVMMAARLYQQGKVRQLVTTGKLHGWSASQSVGPATATARIWTELGIPEQAIIQVGGRNTTEEMQQIRRLLQPQPGQRVGLLTSAFHLPRAMRLAQANGVDVQPLAADFRTGSLSPWPLALIPSSEGFMKSELFVKECLAYLVGR